MLLFSAIFDINQTLTRDLFIQLVIEWNQSSAHESNVVPGIDWKGERNIRYGNENLWLEIQEYRNQSIVAVRHEKREENGAVWDSDFIMNFKQMKMSVRLDRSFKAEALTIDSEFATPHFIAMLIEKGYIKKDGKLPISKKITIINRDNQELLLEVVNRKRNHILPVVYISKTIKNEDPVDTGLLASKLKGVAHVFVQESNQTQEEDTDTETTEISMEKTDTDENSGVEIEHDGSIGIYDSNPAIGHRRYMYRSSEGVDIYLMGKVIQFVIQNSNAQLVDPLFTWQGVNNAMLKDRLEHMQEERAAAEDDRRKTLYELLELKENLDQTQQEIYKKAQEDAKLDADRLLDEFDEDIKKLQDEVVRLSNAIERLEYENAGLRAKLNSNNSIPIIFKGEEDDYYEGESRDFVLLAVNDELSQTEPNTRRYDVLHDILEANEYKEIGKKRAEEVKRLLSNYSGMTPKLKQGLKDVGFIFDQSDHQKLKYYGDDRYTVIYASTPSDKGRSGKNNANITVKKAF